MNIVGKLFFIANSASGFCCIRILAFVIVIRAPMRNLAAVLNIGSRLGFGPSTVSDWISILKIGAASSYSFKLATEEDSLYPEESPHVTALGPPP